MDSIEQIHNFINSISYLPSNIWQNLVSHSTSALLKKKDHFVREGEISQEIGILIQGIVRSYYITEEGKEYNKTLFAAPCIIGSYVSLITGEPNQLPQQALTNCQIVKIPLSVIEQLSEKNIELERLRRKIAEQFFVLKEKRELEMVLLPAEDRYKIFRNEFEGVEQLIPQYHIASYLGITATQLSRIRKKISGKGKSLPM